MERAWRWIRSSPDASYKSYFRHLYRNYAVASDVLLSDLSDRLKRTVYRPTKASKIFFPKPSGILRPYSLLCVEDQIVYQSAVNLVAEKLYPRVNHLYNKKIFGHLYAGKSSTWFYRKWSDGYKAFNDAARNAYADGFIYVASFDLTACYDSLDHGVLRHFLEKLGLDHEFCRQLTDWLEVWTATEHGIFQNHGIPQGPLPSGLLSEVVLSHFDSLRASGITFHYFRYVDDIRLFSKNENDLRRLLVTLDLLSKDIGLFPQSNKIRIHQVHDIEKELKSISNPPEVAIKQKLVNQKKLFQRVVALTPHYIISDSTRFKYLLAHADASSVLTSRLWRILEKNPEIYKSICNYLCRYLKIPRVPAKKILEIIKTKALYHSVQAEFIAVADGKLPESQDDELARYLKSKWSPTNQHADLLSNVGIYLMRTGHLSARQVIYACNNAHSWWTRATLINNLDSKYIGAGTVESICCEGILDDNRDVALAAGWKIFWDGITLTGKRTQWNPSGAILLREVGFIQRSTAIYCGIEKSFQKLDQNIACLKWKKLLGYHYFQAERQAVEILALSGTNITAFVNAFDVFNDLLLDRLFSTDGTIGKYTLGNIGGALNANSKFAAKFPLTFLFVHTIHDSRYMSMYSHPRVRTTTKPTKKINYRFLGRARLLLKNAVKELSIAGF
jgi:retron-type reverse transcriptase